MLIILVFLLHVEGNKIKFKIPFLIILPNFRGVLESRQFFSYSRISQHFMEPES
jgi:hypothetical protein